LSVKRNTSLYLTKKEYSFVSNMAEQCAGNGVSQVSPSMILRNMIRLLHQLEVNVSGVKTEDQLLKQLQIAVQRKR